METVTIKETTRELIAWARNRRGADAGLRKRIAKWNCFRAENRTNFRRMFFENRSPLTDVTN